jgi:hypothetical protein
MCARRAAKNHLNLSAHKIKETRVLLQECRSSRAVKFTDELRENAAMFAGGFMTRATILLRWYSKHRYALRIIVVLERRGFYPQCP